VLVRQLGVVQANKLKDLPNTMSILGQILRKAQPVSVYPSAKGEVAL
jgi:hypothetical protein